MGGRQTGRRRHDLRRSAAHGHRQFVSAARIWMRLQEGDWDARRRLLTRSVCSAINNVVGKKKNIEREEAPGRALQSRIERLLGARIEAWRQVEGGYTPTLRLLCQTAAGTFFVKVGSTPLTCRMIRSEILNYTLIHG